jgi:serine protease Do
MDLSEAFVNLAEVVTPGVVRIEARRPTSQGEQVEVPDAFRRFFDFPQEHPELPPSQGQLSGGSGFIVSADGYILTNNHVVEGADQVRVYLPDRRYFDAELVGNDPYTDVAVIKIDAGAPLSAMSFGDSDEVRVGEWVLAIGNPGFGASTQLDYTVTAGIVSARGRGLGLLNDDLSRQYGREQAGFAIEDFIQTDAVINPGNSGGPMVNLRGQVVGINSAIASQTGFYVGYGGVTIEDVQAEDAEVYKLPKVSGVLVQELRDDGPARGILEPEDVIVALDGEPVGYVAELQAKIAARRPGDRVELTIYREGRSREVTIRLDEAPINDRPVRTAERTVHAEERLGINVEYVDAAAAREVGYDRAGVVVSEVALASPAYRRNLSAYRGWMLVQVNDTVIESPEDVRSALEAAEGGQIVSLHLENPQGEGRVVNVRMPG